MTTAFCIALLFLSPAAIHALALMVASTADRVIRGYGNFRNSSFFVAVCSARLLLRGLVKHRQVASYSLDEPLRKFSADAAAQ